MTKDSYVFRVSLFIGTFGWLTLKTHRKKWTLNQAAKNDFFYKEKR